MHIGLAMHAVMAHATDIICGMSCFFKSIFAALCSLSLQLQPLKGDCLGPAVQQMGQIKLVLTCNVDTSEPR